MALARAIHIVDSWRFSVAGVHGWHGGRVEWNSGVETRRAHLRSRNPEAVKQPQKADILSTFFPLFAKKKCITLVVASPEPLSPHTASTSGNHFPPEL